jgi:hypothetical protein
VSRQTFAKGEQPVLSPSFPLNLDNDTGLLTTDEVDQVFWDNDSRPYAIGQAAGKPFVFTVTPTTNGQALGSPYTITDPTNVVVLPR